MKNALLVGINRYKTPGSDLQGCVNDVENMMDMLTTKFKFDSIIKLTDKKATTKNIKSELEDLINQAEVGDIILFHYSGHGSQVKDYNKDETDGVDEIICPHDLNWQSKMITDDYIYKTFSKLKDGVTLVYISDSCHSGSMLRNAVSEKELIEVPKFLTPPDEVLEEIFKAKSAIYDNDAKMTMIMADGKKKKETFENVNGILLSGCESTQTSADAYINRKYQGAFTATLLYVLKKFNYDITYKDLIQEVNRRLDILGYSQNPQLQCKQELEDLKFLK